MDIPKNLDFIALILLSGIFLGIFISFFIIKKSFRTNRPNLFMGLFIVSLSMVMLEGWLNYTGFIFDFLQFSNFAEPVNFIMAPLLYMFVSSQLGDDRHSKCWLHFVPFVFWLGYCMFYFLQPDAVKYNDTIEVMQLDIPLLEESPTFSDDPWGVRQYVNVLTGISFGVYILLMFKMLFAKSKSLGQSVFKTTDKTLVSMRNMFYHTTVVLCIFVFVKLIFKNDVGDHFIYLYLTLMIYATAAQIMDRSSYYNQASTFLEAPTLKYKKSSLDQFEKNEILKSINSQMIQQKYYLSGTASLSGLAKAINETPHHVSQVINEKLGQSFFELLATHRVEEAKTILKTDMGKKLTIEEVAERVGYNSKSAFNTAFKRHTSQTPSAYRDL
ncbi:helix-turn-helix domain-containing protein [Spongiimicrobium sp. 3-5]|uniref:helix-turn-helix domain-containing protein n=1 Tax=Spongiimicrobium sp. 3-5 TaxID=3332596 RepID=UPI0039804516